MRNPIDRAWSAVKMEARNKSLDLQNEQQIIDFINSDNCRKRGNYLRTLDNWKRHYNDNQFFIAFFEEAKSNPKELFFSICKFLDVNPELPKYLNKIISPGQKNTMPPNISKFLSQLYYEDIKCLQKMFGGYVNKWLAKAESQL